MIPPRHQRWWYAAIAVILAIWVNFFPDTQPLNEALQQGSRGMEFNKNYPLHTIWRVIYSVAAVLLVWHAWKGRHK